MKAYEHEQSDASKHDPGAEILMQLDQDKDTADAQNARGVGRDQDAECVNDSPLHIERGGRDIGHRGIRLRGGARSRRRCFRLSKPPRLFFRQPRYHQIRESGNPDNPLKTAAVFPHREAERGFAVHEKSAA